jgi:2-haloacid dehalogenase
MSPYKTGEHKQAPITMSSQARTIIAFDLYGTLLSTESIRDTLATLVQDEKATSIAAQWRRYQLEYTWRLNSMGKSLHDHRHSSELRCDSLGYNTTESSH